MNVFKVGEETRILDGYNEDCTVFEVDEAGLNIFYYYSSPTEEEMQAFEPDVPGEIRLARIDDILFLFCKLGTLAWAEMPYAIQLSKLTNLPKPEEGEGYNLTIMLIDRDTSVIKRFERSVSARNFRKRFGRKRQKTWQMFFLRRRTACMCARFKLHIRRGCLLPRAE